MLGPMVVPKTLQIKWKILTCIIWCEPLDPHPNSLRRMFSSNCPWHIFGSETKFTTTFMKNSSEATRPPALPQGTKMGRRRMQAGGFRMCFVQLPMHEQCFRQKKLREVMIPGPPRIKATISCQMMEGFFVPHFVAGPPVNFR